MTSKLVSTNRTCLREKDASFSSVIGGLEDWDRHLGLIKDAADQFGRHLRTH